MAKRTSKSEANETSLRPAAPIEKAPRVVKAPRRSMALAQPSVDSVAPTEEDIRYRAYLRYIERGGNEGGEFDDWVNAERELKNGG